MNNPLSSRYIILVLTLAILATLLSGAFHAFAAEQATPTSTSASLTPGPLTPTLETITPTPTLKPSAPSGDTNGIIAMSVVLVAIVLFGVLWGGRTARIGKPKAR